MFVFIRQSSRLTLEMKAEPLSRKKTRKRKLMKKGFHPIPRGEKKVVAGYLKGIERENNHKLLIVAVKRVHFPFGLFSECG